MNKMIQCLRYATGGSINEVRLYLSSYCCNLVISKQGFILLCKRFKNIHNLSFPNLLKHLNNGIYHYYFLIQRLIIIKDCVYNTINGLEKPKTENESDEREKIIFIKGSHHRWSNGTSCSSIKSVGVNLEPIQNF